MSVFEEYSQYYNLLYRDKDYEGEADFIQNIIITTIPKAKTILDLGCGTGRHARLFAKMGFTIYGVDNSQAMLEIARNELTEKNVFFSEGDIRSIRLNQTFDVVVALFHVISYQITNDDLWKSLMTAYHHLASGGIFIFDFWYGPTVLTQGPSVKIKRVEDEAVDITRIAEPYLNHADNTVTVHYQLFVKDKVKSSTLEIKEKHQIRYLFRPELEFMLYQIGFSLINFLSYSPKNDSWDALVVVRKN